jgi:hypothetical protein
MQYFPIFSLLLYFPKTPRITFLCNIFFLFKTVLRVFSLSLGPEDDKTELLVGPYLKHKYGQNKQNTNSLPNIYFGVFRAYIVRITVSKLV